MISNPSITFTVTRTVCGTHLHLADEPAHDTGSLDCWCLPQYFRVCSECESTPMAGVDILGCAPPHAGCWACTHGLVAVSRIEAEHVGMALVVVHR